MATIVTRSAKGSALTWQEGDDNFTNLNNDKIEAVVDDTTPQLGGNLDVNGHNIVSTANADVTIAPNGTGIVVAQSDLQVGYGNQTAAITSNGAYDLDLVTNGGTNSGVVRIHAGSNANIEILPNGTGRIDLDGVLWPAADGTNGQVLTTNGAGQLSFTTVSGGITDLVQDTTPQLGGNLDVNGQQIVSVSNGNIILAPNGTGIVRADKSVQIQAQGEIRLADSDSSNYVGFKSPATVSSNLIWTLPSTDGTAGQLLSTNGSGVLSWATDATGGGGSGVGNVILLSSSDTTGRVTFPATTNTVSNSHWTLTSSGNVSGVSVNTTNKTFTLPAGTYLVCFPTTVGIDNNKEGSFKLYNETSSTDLITISSLNITMNAGGSTKTYYGATNYNLVLTGSTTLSVRTTVAIAGGFNVGMHWVTRTDSYYVLTIYKIA